MKREEIIKCNTTIHRLHSKAAHLLFKSGLNVVTDTGPVNEAGASSIPGGTKRLWLCLPSMLLPVYFPYITTPTFSLSHTQKHG